MIGLGGEYNSLISWKGSYKMLIKEDILIPYLKKKRTLHIYLPDNISKDEHFPVFYMFDGHNLFKDEDATYGKSWGLLDYFTTYNIRCMIVGIECNHVGNHRLREFSPYSFQDETWGNVNASGKKFLDWMTSDLKKYIDNTYPTLSDREHTYLGGSSMGGLMAVYGGAMYPHIYSKSACLSPYYDHVLSLLISDLTKLKTFKDSTFYISFGRHEWRTKRALSRGVEENLQVMRILTEKNAKCYMHCYEFGYHSEASWEKEIPNFLHDLNIK